MFDPETDNLLAEIAENLHEVADKILELETRDDLKVTSDTLMNSSNTLFSLYIKRLILDGR